MKKIKLIIDSDLHNVSLIGMTTNRLCSLSPFLDAESYNIELCVVEAVNNCIIHAYENKNGYEVEVVFSFNSKTLTIEVCDTGKSMDPEFLKTNNIPSLEINPDDFDIPEGGRGLAIIHQIMDKVAYRSVKGKNILSMIKRF